MKQRSETPDGMRIEWDVPIEMDDGVVLRADVFRPDDQERHPVICSYGPYGKGLSFEEGFTGRWHQLVAEHPEVLEGTSGRYANFEVVDPEKWVPDGYVCVRIDSRGAGRSPGHQCLFQKRETQDLYECIEWAANQPWSNGKVGLSGISYLAMNQWHVASLQPPHLVAMIPWEGAADFYRDATHHGGIRSTFWEPLCDQIIARVQHGVGERGFTNPNTGKPVAGPETLDPDQLRENRCDFGSEMRAHPLDDGWHQVRSPDWSRVQVPFLSAGNWGGHGLHLRGNVEAFTRAASDQKWLEIHGLEHWTHYYTGYGVALQKQFFEHYLKGVDNGWARRPPVLLQIRTVDGFVEREEHEWPLERTRWSRLHLDPAARSLSWEPVAEATSVSYEALTDAVTFLSPSFESETEITGPVAARLHMQSSTTDADLFVILRLFNPDGGEVTFAGAQGAGMPVGQGWLRASHRALDPGLTRDWRPYHPHVDPQPLTPGEIYAVEVEMWPTCIVVPAGYRLGLTVRGTDHEFAALAGSEDTPKPRGPGHIAHDDPQDRPPEVYGGTVSLHGGGEYEAYLLLPVIPG